MDILGIAHEINSELRHIRSQYPHVLSAEERSDIFDSIETCLINELADVIELSVRNGRDKQELLKWSYNLSDKNYPERIGIDIQTILASLNKIKQEAYLDCVVKWSSQFLELDPPSQEKLLCNTIWDKNYTITNDLDRSSKKLGLRDKHESLEQKINDSNICIDLSIIENELLKLASETELLGSISAKQITNDLQKCFLNNYIRGVEFSILENHKKLIIIQWKFELNSSNNLVRSGEPLPLIIEQYQENKEYSCLKIQLKFTEKFKRTSEEDQLYIKNTIFEKSDSLILKKKEAG
ncbi:MULTISPECIES: hypothetical protein [Kamptonema]|uniref:hypothetical protein n=1 Tax=Kamptonema TaxID=1501433 RepID=UPI0001DAD55F|nr:MULTISPECIES: hypothetical protein [Kamptonema]CBN53559.1 hypothetical protein OSCI_10026 [Kamptonema sp. PCC 6506]